ncbi:MAG: DUF418 domain-containing protein [Ignavibacterium album]|uniref:DUF418 domain-containing protein n=1 Tax=Ignavibacterium album TaxID=591197 RepID=UPI0026EB30EC|nr:DUF418 domain-containing protein [Ignavibacterium album]MCX8106370.1 DUF418 domain-containing protein [Ignavibacterium album]
MKKQRIQIADALRGFTLLAILLLHFIEHFDLAIYPDNENTFLATIDSVISRLAFLTFKGKAYAIFSLLFGFSFYIQVKNWEEKGYDFKGRFIWRLFILFIIGYFHSLFYLGDVLTVLALLGLPLIFLYKLDTKKLFSFSLLFFLQIPSIIYFFLSHFFNVHIPINVQENTALVSDTYAYGSLTEVIKFNATEGFLEKWHFIISTGRYSQMFGLFILGIIIGRIKLFDELIHCRNKIKKIFLISTSLAIIFFGVYSIIPKLHLNIFYSDLFEFIFKSYANLAMTFVLLIIFIALYEKIKGEKTADYFASYGRMSLTNYLMQSVFAVTLLYGAFLGLYKFINPSLGIIIAILFFMVHIVISYLWFKKFSYGPVEWFWRKLTLLSFSKNKF